MTTCTMISAAIADNRTNKIGYMGNIGALFAYLFRSGYYCNSVTVMTNIMDSFMRSILTNIRKVLFLRIQDLHLFVVRLIPCSSF